MSRPCASSRRQGTSGPVDVPNAKLPAPGRSAPTNLHATCVSVAGRGLLILGASGTGKSSLALQLMALGALLVADDRVDLHRDGGRLVAHAPAPLSGLIEARGLGLLNAPTVVEADIALILDLDRTETQRLPRHRKTTLCDVQVDLVFDVPKGHLAAALLQYMMFGRAD